MYKSFSSALLGFPSRSIRDDIPLAIKHGYGGINFDIKKEASEIPPAEFTDLLAQGNLKNGGFNLPVDFRKTREIFDSDLAALRPCCEFARKTGTTRCATWLMPCHDTLDYKANFGLHRERLGETAKLLEEFGIRLGFEFVGPPSLRRGKPHEFIHDLEGLNELIAAIGTSNLGYLLDVFHWDLAGQSFEDFKKIQGQECVVMAHINDAPGGLSREEQIDQQRELPGATGVLRVDEFMKGLQDMGYDGPVLVEPFYAPLKAMPFEDAVVAAKAGMDKVWPKG